jgi:hypothetical protein
MRNSIFLTGVASLILPLAVPVQALEKGGGQKSDNGKSAERKGGSGDANGRANKSEGKAQSHSSHLASDRSNAGHKEAKFKAKLPSQGGNASRNDWKNDRKADKNDGVNLTRREFDRGDNFRMRSISNGRYSWRPPTYQGCPPGLAKKNNGCLPPGQARKIGRFDDQQSRWFRYSNWYSENRSGDWRYDRGFVYRIDPATNLAQLITPLLGGALFGGNIWPQGYTDYDATPYYSLYYGAGVNQSIRYADGAVFRVDPKTQVISSVVGLLTGDNWNVGSPAPQGYDLYNVPAIYRDQYADSDTSAYRYNDGRVYEVDPTTLIVRKIIDLVL